MLKPLNIQYMKVSKEGGIFVQDNLKLDSINTLILGENPSVGPQVMYGDVN